MALSGQQVRELPALPGPPELVLRAFAYWMAQYRRTWRGTSVSTVLEPLGFLAAMGLGLGLLVDRGTGSATLPDVGYLEWIAPGLLAATAMQAASFESSYPVMGAIRWNKQYHGMLATPLRVVDVLAGHLLFVAFRLTITTSVFLMIMAVFGAVGSPWAVLAMPAAVLTGMAYAPAIFAFSATLKDNTGFAMLFRFGIMPMFLFSGTFFPIDQLPVWMQPLAWVTPLWHGVELCRDAATGTAPGWLGVVHLAVLLTYIGVGWLLARASFTRRLVS